LHLASEYSILYVPRWITEGFASYFEYVASFNVSQEFDQADRLISDDTQPAMAFDIGPASVPIHGKDTETFVEIPSTINYSKGAALIHMMSAFIPTGHFIPALQHYLKKRYCSQKILKLNYRHLYGRVSQKFLIAPSISFRSYTAVDQYALFDDMTEYLELKGALPSNGLTIREIMDTWTLQTAFPLIRVSRASPTRIYLSQERFGGSDGGLFHVPISFATASDPAFDGLNLEPKFWIDSKTVLKSQTVEDTNQWMVYNVDARGIIGTENVQCNIAFEDSVCMYLQYLYVSKGYYRVLYDDHFEGLLKEQLQTGHDVISIPSRSQILDDYFVSAFESEIQSYVI
jgi:aminopeptidase N